MSEQPVLDRSSQHQSDVRHSIAEGSALSQPYLIMNALATIVASYGLLANSAAVVIGAMIIAMLLGPIMGLALALVDGDNRLLRNSLLAEAVGAAMVVAIGLVIGKIHADIAITTEILSRTKPNLLDLAVALAGGAAGAYATVSPRVSVGLVGVAISTALVPPLASVGICLSRGLYPQAGGALLLFATNLVAIQCASSAVLYLAGFHKLTHRDENDTRYVWRLLFDALAFLGLAVFLYIQLASAVDQEQFEKAVRDELTAGLRSFPGSYLSDTRFIAGEKAEVVVAVVTTPFSITPQQTAQLQAELTSHGQKPIELHVRSLLTKETTAKGYLHQIDPNAAPVDSVTGTDAIQPDARSNEPTPP